MKRLGAVLTSCLGLLALAATAQPASAAGFKVVVNDDNPVVTLSKAEVGKLFLKKDTRWESGATVEPVDLVGDSAVREEFSKEIQNKAVGAVKSYWQRQIFSGRGTPPPELSSDADVVAYVKTHPWAIGYVDAGAAVGQGVKVVKVVD
jgi:ABC-type phosphate transport system substrate-binding protein